MVVMGRIAGAFGIKGWVKIQTFTAIAGQPARVSDLVAQRSRGQR